MCPNVLRMAPHAPRHGDPPQQCSLQIPVSVSLLPFCGRDCVPGACLLPSPTISPAPHPPSRTAAAPLPVLEHSAPSFHLSVTPQESGLLFPTVSEASFSLTTGPANLGEPSRLATWGRGRLSDPQLSPASGTLPLPLLIGMLVRPTGGIKALGSTELSGAAGIGETKAPQSGEEGE